MTTYIESVVEEVKNELHIKDERLAQLYALLVLAKGADVTLKDVHDAWALNMNYKKQTEYCYGREHRSIVPFNELNETVQNKDVKFVEGLRRIAQKNKR